MRRCTRELAITGFETAGGKDNPELWRPLAALGRALAALGKPADARPALERALAIGTAVQLAPAQLQPARDRAREAMKIAIVGSGIAGLGAADVLAGAHDVTLFEAAPRAGGHVYTVDTDDGPVDMGFIVHNREHYPLFCALLGRLGVPSRPTTMAFSVADGYARVGQRLRSSAMFADRRNLASPRHWRFLVRVVRFLAQARRDLGPARSRNAIARRVPGGAPRAARRPRSLRDPARGRAVVARAGTLRRVPGAVVLRVPRPARHAGAESAARVAHDRRRQPALRRCAARGAASAARIVRSSSSSRRRYASILRDAAGVSLVTASGTRRFDRVIVATHADTRSALARRADRRGTRGARRDPLQPQPHRAAHRSRVPAAPSRRRTRRGTTSPTRIPHASRSRTP